MHSVRGRRIERIDALLSEWPARDLAALARLLGRFNGAIALVASHQDQRDEAQTPST